MDQINQHFKHYLFVKSSLFVLLAISKQSEKWTRVQSTRNTLITIILIISKRQCFEENRIIITNSYLNNNLSRKSILTANRLDFRGRTRIAAAKINRVDLYRFQI